ncbi:hypothetical protein DW322_17910 [Rhodococcus rhodnii]|uniref:Secreted protein n=2 Tax=Rhodococcus rhodnii TaxID=38312 RepID=R7WPV5_9NOCA|nr:hypothetical protein [Rhodococcus rhodnii]EOM77347.1 hypothetical protein Rrhod_1300 [Rhodococcus rhodnii LMG 5362]TXG91721.1 hypothetical protein DW322_17910 [Rhodococcus rhodnii]
MSGFGILRSVATSAAVLAAAAFAAPVAGAQPAAGASEPAAVTELRESADLPQEKDAVEALTRFAGLSDVAGTLTPFFYTAPTIGCGTFAPVTMTLASAQTGPAAGIGVREVNFQALSAYPGVVQGSGLSVAWLNTATGASGIEPLDGTTEGGYPSLSKLVHTGSGTVVAAIFGSVAYSNATCHVLPTVGSFFVPDEGPMPSEATG